MRYKFISEKGRVNGQKLRLSLTTSMNSLKKSLEDLEYAIYSDVNHPIWVFDCSAAENPRVKILGSIQSLDYQPGQSGTDSLLCPALIGASANTLICIQKLNIARKALAEVLKEFIGIDVIVEDELTGSVTNRQWVRVVLAMLGHSRLNQRQTTRTFRCFNQQPAQVSYSWVNMRRVEYTTSKNILLDLEKRLKKHAGLAAKSLETEYNKVSALGHREPLAIVTQLNEQVRANVMWTDEAQNVVKRAQFYAGTPIFYPAQSGHPLPKLRRLPDRNAPRSYRMKRSDLKLESEPFLPRLRIYRYRAEYREEAIRRAKERLKEK